MASTKEPASSPASVKRPSGHGRTHRRTFETCLMAPDEVALSDRLVRKFPAIRFLKAVEAFVDWKYGPPFPPIKVYRSMEDVPGEGVWVIAVSLPEDWRPAWVLGGSAQGPGTMWRVENFPLPRMTLGRSRIYQARPQNQEPRFNAPPIVVDYLKSMEMRIHWDSDDQESKRTAMSMLSVFPAVTTQEVQVAYWTRPLKWTEIRDRVRYGRHAMAWSVAASQRMLGFYGRVAALPRGIDPKSLGFDDSRWSYFRPGEWR